jgi:hypothetical protein
VNFEPDWGFPLIAKLALGSAGLALLIAAALLRFIYSRVRRSLKRRKLKLS